MVIQNMIIAFVAVLFQIFMREKPAVPPSAVAEADEDEADLWQSFKAMKGNSNFMLLTLSFSLTFGSYIAFSNVISNLMDPFGLTPRTLAFIAIGLLVSGIIGSVLAGIYVDKTGKYKSTVLLMLFATGCVFLAMSLALHGLWLRAFFVTALLLGLAGVGYIPIVLSFGVELMFPMPAATVNGIMLLLVSGFGFIASLVVAFISDDAGSDALLTEEELALTR